MGVSEVATTTQVATKHMGTSLTVTDVVTYRLVELDGFSADSGDKSVTGESHEAETTGGNDAEIEDRDLVSGLPAHADNAIGYHDNDDFAVEDEPLLAQDREQAVRSSRRGSKLAAAQEQNMSSPLGLREPVGPGGRRLSNGLGQSNNGLGTGGGSFH